MSNKMECREQDENKKICIQMDMWTIYVCHYRIIYCKQFDFLCVIECILRIVYVFVRIISASVLC
jgi:hypothetical protein